MSVLCVTLSDVMFAKMCVYCMCVRSSAESVCINMRIYISLCIYIYEDIRISLAGRSSSFLSEVKCRAPVSHSCDGKIIVTQTLFLK